MRVSINIVTYNSLKDIDACLKSIFNQTNHDWRVLIVDNHSDDGTVEHIRATYPTVTVLQNFKNLGFAKAQNQALKFWDSEYALICNPDVVLAPTWLAELIAAADAHPTYGSLTGKIIRFSDSDQSTLALTPEHIDSTGLAVTRGRRFYDRGAGEEDRGQYDQSGDVFGVSGCVGFYRRPALEAVKLPSEEGRRRQRFAADQIYWEYFDENFFMYQEDADLAWRLQFAGWPAYYVSTAEASHRRSGFSHASGEVDLRQAISDRRRKSQFINHHSYLNHWLLLIKNLAWSDLLRHGYAIVWYEFKKFGWLCLAEQRTLAVLPRLWRLLPATIRKRQVITQRRRTTPVELRPWWQ
ncbi:MAG: glycosyltransferase family 2 protein [Patescibacteria group bacterium]